MAKTLVYRMYPKSWESFAKMAKHLPIVKAVHADYVLLSPFFNSSQNGRKTINYTGNIGTLTEFEAFIEETRRYKLKVMLDLPLFNLNWFSDVRIDSALVEKVRQELKFWMSKGVAGFYIKDLACTEHEPGEAYEDSLNRSEDIKVLRALFDEPDGVKNAKGERPFLVVECYGDSYRQLSKKYSKRFIDHMVNVKILEVIKKGSLNDLYFYLDSYSKCPRYMIDLENHETNRYLSNFNIVSFPTVMLWLFRDEASVCLYQGQEFGLRNPGENILSDQDIFRLDPTAKYLLKKGMNMRDIRLHSPANTRTILDLKHSVENQEERDSYFKVTKIIASHWKLRR